MRGRSGRQAHSGAQQRRSSMAALRRKTTNRAAERVWPTRRLAVIGTSRNHGQPASSANTPRAPQRKARDSRADREIEAPAAAGITKEDAVRPGKKEETSAFWKMRRQKKETAQKQPSPRRSEHNGQMEQKEPAGESCIRRVNERHWKPKRDMKDGKRATVPEMTDSFPCIFSHTSTMWSVGSIVLCIELTRECDQQSPDQARRRLCNSRCDRPKAPRCLLVERIDHGADSDDPPGEGLCAEQAKRPPPWKSRRASLRHAFVSPFLSLSTGARLAPAAARFVALQHKRRARRLLRPSSSGAAAIIVIIAVTSSPCLHGLLLLAVFLHLALLFPLAFCPFTDAVFSPLPLLPRLAIMACCCCFYALATSLRSPVCPRSLPSKKRPHFCPLSLRVFLSLSSYFPHSCSLISMPCCVSFPSRSLLADWCPQTLPGASPPTVVV